MPLRTIAPAVHIHDRPLSFFGMQLGARMTVLTLPDGLLLHSPTDLDPADLAHLGTPRWILAPNKFHHLHAGPWIDRGLQAWCAPGLPTKRPDLSFHHTVTEACTPFGDDVLLIPLSCFSLTNEVVLLHRPSRTLVVTDLVFNITADAPWLTKAILCSAGGYPGCKTTTLERVGMNRAAARSDLTHLLQLDFDRIIPSHGAVIETGGKQALRDAFAWLGLPDATA